MRTGEAMLEGIGSVAEKALPALIELGKQKQQQPIAPMYQPPEQMRYPPGSNPPEGLQQNPNSQPPNTTPSEEDMAKIRDEMYLNPPPSEENKG